MARRERGCFEARRVLIRRVDRCPRSAAEPSESFWVGDVSQSLRASGLSAVSEPAQDQGMV